MLSALRTNPFRAVNWMWQRVCGIVDRSQPTATSRRDGKQAAAWIRKGVRFKLAYARAINPEDQCQLAINHPEVFWAHWLFTQERHPARYAVEAYLMARQTDREVGLRCGVPPEVVNAYESLFFNVREKLNYPEYILHCVLGESIQKGIESRNFDLLWKLYGYFCGPHLVASLTSGFPVNVWCQSSDSVSSAIQDDAIATMKLKAAIAAKTIPVNQRTQLGLLEQFTKFVEIERLSETDGKSKEVVMSHLAAALASLPMRVGPNHPNTPDTSALAIYDDGAAELSYPEMLHLTVTGDAGKGTNISQLRFPETINSQAEVSVEQIAEGHHEST